MQGFIAFVFSLLLLSSATTAATKTKVAAAPPTVSVKKAYSYCLINGPIQNFKSGTIWATPVFEFEYDALEPVDPTAKHANAFYNQLGGGGEKSCGGLHASAGEAQASRDNYQATMTKRMGLWKTKWIDVAYTPTPWAPSTVAKGARVPQYLYCWASDMEPNVRKSVASNVLSITMPQMGDPAYMSEHTWYDEHFKQEVLLANGLPGGTGVCIYKDSFAEATESLNTMRKTFSGFNLRWVDAVWNPAGPEKKANEKVVAPVTKPANKPPVAVKTPVTTPPVTTPIAAPKVPDVMMYCLASINNTKSVWYSSIWTETYSNLIHQHLGASLEPFFEYVRTSEPEFFGENSYGKLTSPECQTGIASCVATSMKDNYRDALIVIATCARTRAELEVTLANPRLKGNGHSKFNTARTLEWLPASYSAP